ncbi:MAG: LPS export ABC transporter permease LptF [Betaproteobacteria bacterium]|nr:LPS export ABC transporter permease LptF [Betaproteobacteria bacterium]
MSLFRRSLLSEFAANGAGVLSILLLVIVSTQIIRVLRMATSALIPMEGVFALVGFTVLTSLPIVMGGSLFVAVLLTLIRCYRDSEMFVWFSAGLSLKAWVRPVLMFALPSVIVIAVLTFFVYPWAAARLEQYQRQLESRDETALVREGVFQESKRADWVYFVEELDPDSGRVKNVFVQSKQRDGAAVMIAHNGLIETHENGDRFLVLLDGHRYEGMPGSPEYRTMDFQRLAVRIEPAEARKVLSPAKTLATGELIAQSSPANLAELVWRLGLPLSALLLALLAVPLSSVNPRVGRSFNLIAAVLLYFLYSNAISISESLVASGRLSAWAAVLGVHGAMVTVVVLFFYRRMSLRWLPVARSA